MFISFVIAMKYTFFNLKELVTAAIKDIGIVQLPVEKSSVAVFVYNTTDVSKARTKKMQLSQKQIEFCTAE